MVDNVKAHFPETGDFFDSGQVDNLVHGVVNNKDGLEQWMYSVGETLGLQAPGTLEYYTNKANKRRSDYSKTRSANLPGAGAVEVVGEILPWLAAPTGAGSLAKGAFIGAGIGASVFDPDPTATRLDNALIGAGIGGLFGKLTKGRELKQHIDDFESQKLLTGPTTGQLVPSSPMPYAGRSANRSEDIIEGEFRGIGQARLAGPSQKALPPPPVSTGEVLGARQLGRDANRIGFDNALEGKFKNLDVAEYKLAQKNAEISHAMKRLQKAEDAVKKSKNVGGSKTMAQKILREEREELAKDKFVTSLIAKDLAKSRKVLSAPKKEAVAPKTINEGELELRGSRLYLDGRPISKSDVLGIINDKTPAHEYISLDPTGFTSKGVRDFYNNRLGKGQAGEIDQRLLLAGGGAVAGGLAGGAASDGDPAAIAAGVLGGGLGGAFLGRGVGKSRFFNEAADKASKAKMNTASSDASKFVKGAKNELDKGSTTTGKAADYLSSGLKILDEFIGSVDTRIRNIAPKIAVALQETEYRTHAIANGWLTRAEPLWKALDNMKLPDSKMITVKSMILSNRKNAEAWLRKNGESAAADELAKVGTVLDDVRTYMTDAGYKLAWREGYFPRQVLDTSYFENIKEVQTHLAYLANKKGTHLSEFEKEDALTKLFSGAINKSDDLTFGNAAASLKKRKWNIVFNERANAYADPAQGFNNYIEEVVRQVERQRFLKGQGVDKAVGANGENLESAAAVMARLMKSGGMGEKEADEVAKLIQLRFGKGEQAPARWIQNFKNYTYTGLLGNPVSAATQLGDVALSLHKNGIVNTTVALTKSLASMFRPMSNGLDKQTLLGLRDAAQDFASNVKSRDLLNMALKYSGFRAMDRLGKNTFINAAMLKNQKMNKESFFGKWNPVFGKETNKLWDDVQKFEQITPENRDTLGFMLFNELSSVQPITLSTLPQRYLQHPDGRMAYMLQSFTIRMLNTIREDVLQNIGKGDYKTAAYNLVKLSSMFTMLNGNVDMVKDVMVGKDLKKPAEYYANAYAKMFGIDRFTIGTVEKEGLGAAIGKTILPPTILLDALGSPEKAIGLVPIVGRNIKGAIE